MKQKTHAKDTTMLFESTMVLFFGDKAYQTAGQASTPKYRSQWIKRVLKFVMKAADRIETTPRHKQLLMANAEKVYEAVGNADQHPSWELVYVLLALIGRLLGVSYNRGAILHTVSYWQSDSQRFTSAVFDGVKAEDDYRSEKQDAVSIRKHIVESFTQQGISDFKVAVIQNTTEYEVKQLRHGF